MLSHILQPKEVGSMRDKLGNMTSEEAYDVASKNRFLPDQVKLIHSVRGLNQKPVAVIGHVKLPSIN